MSTTSTPDAIKAPEITLLTMSPDGRASLPMTIFNRLPATFLSLIHAEYAAANLTISTGVKALPGCPPIVPLIPEIDLINVMSYLFLTVQR
jgi:hypothetical protein